MHIARQIRVRAKIAVITTAVRLLPPAVQECFTPAKPAQTPRQPEPTSYPMKDVAMTWADFATRLFSLVRKPDEFISEDDGEFRAAVDEVVDEMIAREAGCDDLPEISDEELRHLEIAEEMMRQAKLLGQTLASRLLHRDPFHLDKNTYPK